MDNLDNFKLFIKQNPTFANYIKDGTMTWQKFYELYDMYGEDSEVWNDYKREPKKSHTINDIVNMAKNIDMGKVQEGITSLQKTLGLFGDLFASKSSSNTKEYNPRPLYRRFDD